MGRPVSLQAQAQRSEEGVVWRAVIGASDHSWVTEVEAWLAGWYKDAID